MSTVNCPHCGAGNQAGAAFCEKCGGIMGDVSDQELDAAAAASQTNSGQADFLKLAMERRGHKKASTVSGIILTAAILMAIGSLVMFLFTFFSLDEWNNNHIRAALLKLAYAGSTGILATILTGLAFWARKSPSPAAFTAVAIHVIFHLVRFGTMMAVSRPKSLLVTSIMTFYLAVIVCGLLVIAASRSLRRPRLQVKGQAAKASPPQPAENPPVLADDRLGDIG